MSWTDGVVQASVKDSSSAVTGARDLRRRASGAAASVRSRGGLALDDLGVVSQPCFLMTAAASPDADRAAVGFPAP